MEHSTCILTPAYNAAKYIGKAIESVQNQTHTNWRMVIVDDGSTDDTLKVAQSYADADSRILVIAQKNSGVSVARNETLQRIHPEAKYVVNLDADDMLEPTALVEMTAYLEAHPRAGALLCDSVVIDAEGKRVVYRKTQRFKLVRNSPVKLRGNAIIPFFNFYCHYGVGPFAMFRAEALKSAGLYNLQLYGCNDVDMFVRIALNWDIHQFLRPLYLYRWHGSNMSIWNAKNQRDQDDFYRIWENTPGETAGQKRLLDDARRFHREWHPLILKGKLLAAYTRDAYRDKGLLEALFFTRKAVPWAVSVAFKYCRCGVRFSRAA